MTGPWDNQSIRVYGSILEQKKNYKEAAKWYHAAEPRTSTEFIGSLYYIIQKWAHCEMLSHQLVREKMFVRVAHQRLAKIYR